MHMRKMTRTAGAIGVVAALLLPAAGASAREVKDPDTGHETVDARSATMSDARLVAEQNDWEPEATLEYVGQSRAFAELATDLSRAFPKTYASAEFAERPKAPSVVRFVGDPPREAYEMAEKSGLPIKVTGGARYSETVLQERAKAVHEHLMRSGFRQVVTATTTDDIILASVYGKGEPDLPRELAQDVELVQSLEPVARDEHTRGGAPLLDDGSFECTSGFSVRNGNGTTGVATAAHCTGLNQYRQPSDGLTYGMTHQGEHNGLFGDFEWKTTSHIEPAEFFATSNQVREVNSVSGLLPVNTPSCVYGRSSNARACDQVFSNFVIVTVSGRTNWFLMAMDNDNTVPGDSGGPWSFATIADGIHKGDVTLSGGRRNMWSRMAY